MAAPHASPPAPVVRAADRWFLVRVAGLVPGDEVQTGLAELGLASHQVRTLLLARYTGSQALVTMLGRLRALGLEVLDVRRMSLGEAHEMRALAGFTVLARLAPLRARLELTVVGDVAPGVHAALTPYATALEALHRRLRTGTVPEARFGDVVLLVESRGVRIASIALAQDAHVPRQRGPSRTVEAGIVAG
jgi:hypothetical protein